MSLSTNTTKLTELKNKANNLPDQNPPASLQEKTVTPTKEGISVVPDSGFDGLSKVTVNGDNNLVPENIKEGVSIFGVSGSLISETPAENANVTLNIISSDPTLEVICYDLETNMYTKKFSSSNINQTFNSLVGTLIIVVSANYSASWLIPPVSNNGYEKIYQNKYSFTLKITDPTCNISLRAD